MNLLLRKAEVEGALCDVRLRGGLVTALAPALSPVEDEAVEDCDGGALLPGLHDHHVHLLAMAADLVSVACGPPSCRTRADLTAALRGAPGEPGTWLRGTGYHETVAGDLTRHDLDAMCPERPVRVQHRSGALWILNSLALERVLDRVADRTGVECASDGTPTGRLWRRDDAIRAAVGDAPADLRAVGAGLRGYGITGVTDASPGLDHTALDLIARAVRDGDLPTRVQVLCGTDLSTAHRDAGLTLGPRKILLPDHALPPLDALVAQIAQARAAARAVAVHCVTLEALVLTLAALDEVGPRAGDRIEHAAVVPGGLAPWAARLGVRVVTQPGFIAARGDTYLDEVEVGDQADLYPYARLLDAGLRVAPSSDAPYGPLDPWAVIAAARDRTAPSGRRVGEDAGMAPRQVLRGYLSPLDDPGGRPRRVVVGAPADLVLLDVPLETAVRDCNAGHVRRVISHRDA